MTATSRRTLLGVGALGVLTLPFATVRAALAVPAGDLYVRSRFTRLQGAVFQLVGPAQTWSVTLERVADLPHAAAGDDRRFGLTFRSATAAPEQGSYTLRRSGFAATPMFVVPGDPGRRTCGAVVNRA